MQTRHTLRSPNPQPSSQFTRTEIAIRYAWQARRNRRPGTKPNFMLFTLREIERLYCRRWRWTLPDNAAGRDALLLAVHHIAHLGGDTRHKIVAWASLWAPWLEREDAEALAAEVIAKPRRWKSASLGWRLQVTEAERDTLKLTRIRAAGVSTAEMKERRRLKQAERMRNLRARRSSGKPVGRPRKIPCAAVSSRP